MKVLVTGGAGYVGCKLVQALLQHGHEVVVLDLYLYGKEVFNDVRPNASLIEIQGDIRDIKKVNEALIGVDAVIHLACISNDPSFELNPKLGKSINLDAFEPLVIAAKKNGVQRFIYASSSSVYGVKEGCSVTEELSLEPLTDYSKFKADCEKILLKYCDDNFVCVTLRPATVCGYSPRQRMDLVVNILTNQAYHTKEILVMGGSQMRASIHIDDMVRAYLLLLEAKSELISGKIFNVGSENHSVLELAHLVKEVVGPVEIRKVPSNDNRSYHISSEKIKRELGFETKKSVKEAIKELVLALESKKLPNALEDKRYFNIKMMKEVNLV